ncbi:MAG TPA: hypothetical protein VMM38_11605 [Aridibacter sp.]|nr:hypothetical protein [Aridibacter sp.]
MNYPSERFVDFFTSPFVYVWLFASVFASVFMLANNPIELPGPSPSHSFEASVSGESETQFEFTSCYGYSGPSVTEFLENEVIEPLRIILFGPPALIVLFIAVVLVNLFPGADPAYYFAAGSVAFLFYNAFYWMTIAYFITRLHEDYIPEHPRSGLISIFEDR